VVAFGGGTVAVAFERKEKNLSINVENRVSSNLFILTLVYLLLKKT
jgi:hypothetical protein